MKKNSPFYRTLYNLFEHPAVFNFNQWLLDGGKTTPVKKFLADVSYQSVLDIGCGTGNWVELARGSYVGIDQSPTFISAARRRHQNRPNTRFILSDVTNWEAEEQFDLVLLVSVLHHLSDRDVAQILQWTSRLGRQLFVLDLYPIQDNPISKTLYALDRGDFIREPADQLSLLESSGAYDLLRQDDFYSWNHLYRHTVFLLQSRSD